VLAKFVTCRPGRFTSFNLRYSVDNFPQGFHILSLYIFYNIFMNKKTPWNETLTEITNSNAFSKSFDFLENEPEIYSIEDINSNPPRPKGHPSRGEF